MLRHFILAFFLIALALPAMAVSMPAAQDASAAKEDCHGVPMKHEGKAPADDHAGLHGCIGCVAPTNAAQPVAVLSAISFVPFADPVRRLSGTSPRPSLPPPRG
jgi:hypothetical protein